MVLPKVVSLAECATPLTAVELPDPTPHRGEVLIRVHACGVCHTELDEIEGRTPPPRFPVVPGHEVVGRVIALGDGVSLHRVGDRVGVGWIHSSSGGDDENVSPAFQATGRDVDGGYAELMTVPERYAFPIPHVFGDAEAAPLLCAGAIGFRALRLTKLPEAGALGLTGFGGSAHLVLQLVRFRLPRARVYVFARDESVRRFALDLGATWAGDAASVPPEPLDAVIDTTPAWRPVVRALGCLKPGGRLVINAIRKEDTDKDALLELSYHDHLWLEREIKTVANITGRDIRELLELAAAVPLRPEITTYRLDEANEALLALKRGRVKGAKVLLLGTDL